MLLLIGAAATAAAGVGGAGQKAVGKGRGGAKGEGGVEGEVGEMLALHQVAASTQLLNYRN